MKAPIQSSSFGIRTTAESSSSSGQATGLEVTADDGVTTKGITATVAHDNNATNANLYAMYAKVGSMGAGTNIGGASCLYMENINDMPGSGGTSGQKIGASALLQGDAREVRGYYSEIDVDNATHVYGFYSLVGSSTHSTGAVFGGSFSAADGTTNVGVYGSGNTYAGQFNGHVIGNTAYQTSDSILKTNVTPITDALAIIAQINPTSFEYKQSDFPQLNLGAGLHYGVLAQEMQTVLPSVVKEATFPEVKDNTGNVIGSEIDILSVSYTELIPILIAAVKEQQQQIDDLNTALNLKIAPVNIELPIEGSERITLSNVASVILNQNDPNPFSESTNITFTIPENIREAKIIFTSNSGVIVNTAIINQRGSGQLEVYSSELSSGIYTYSLVCDGKVIDSKKMMKK